MQYHLLTCVIIFYAIFCSENYSIPQYLEEYSLCLLLEVSGFELRYLINFKLCVYGKIKDIDLILFFFKWSFCVDSTMC